LTERERSYSTKQNTGLPHPSSQNSMMKIPAVVGPTK
jgi:hypothetical protein